MRKEQVPFIFASFVYLFFCCVWLCVYVCMCVCVCICVCVIVYVGPDCCMGCRRQRRPANGRRRPPGASSSRCSSGCFVCGLVCRKVSCARVRCSGACLCCWLCRFVLFAHSLCSVRIFGQCGFCLACALVVFSPNIWSVWLLLASSAYKWLVSAAALLICVGCGLRAE